MSNLPTKDDAICCCQYPSEVEQRLSCLNLCKYLSMAHAQGVKELPGLMNILTGDSKAAMSSADLNVIPDCSCMLR